MLYSVALKLYYNYHVIISAVGAYKVYEAVNAKYKMINKDESFTYVSNRFGINKPYILFVGVWRRYKNLESLAVVFDKLRDRGLDIELVLAGEPDPFYPEVMEHVSRITYHDSVKTPGRVSDEDLIYLYNAAELFVLPSKAEGFGLTLLEAANCGIPIACSDIPVLREVMGYAAEYFDPTNTDNMADVLETLLKDEKRKEELANAALRRAVSFSWRKAAEETINIYKQVIGDRL